MTKNEKLLARREALTAIGGFAPLLFLAGCSSSDSSSAGTTTANADASSNSDGSTSDGSSETSLTDGGDCVEVPDETGGPYPDIDGMISSTTYQRSDITEGKTGTPLALTLQVLNVGNACAPVVGARVIIWHCDASGVYSEYATSMNSGEGESGSTTTTYLRGWQETDANGFVKFTTIYPGWYTPRVTHIHVMVYDPKDLTTPVKTTQFCFPDSVNATVYGQSTLYAKGQNSQTDATDMVFGASDENLIAAITGSPSSGYAASLPIGLKSY